MLASSEVPFSVELPSTALLAEAINDGFLLVGADGRILQSNAKAQQLLRRSATELAASTLWDIVAADTNAAAQEQLRRAVERQVRVECDVFHPRLFTWHEIRATPSPQGLIVILRDITDRQWMIHREAEQACLRKLFMDAPIAIGVMRTPHHQIEFINHEAQKILGGRPVEGLTVKEAFPELVEQGILEIFDHVFQTGETYQVENFRLQFDRHATGVLEETCFNVTYQALRGFNGLVSGILSISIEVTS